MSGSQFYEALPIEQIAINLFYGWGYNFYRKENQLRADDLLIRNKVSWLLSQARGSIEAAEQTYRREFLPAPSREKPRPDATAMANAQKLESLSHAMGALEGQIRCQPVPENDRMTERFRREAPTLAALVSYDQQLTGHAESLRAALQGRGGEWVLENLPKLRETLQQIEHVLQERQAFLQQ